MEKQNRQHSDISDVCLRALELQFKLNSKKKDSLAIWNHLIHREIWLRKKFAFPTSIDPEIPLNRRLERIFKREDCTMNNCESEEIVEAANIAISNLLPTKSRSLYDIAYNRFKKWCPEKNVQVYSENVLLACFSENAKNYNSSTLWAQYSMVKSCLIICDNIDIGKFPKLIAFLKRTGDGYQAKKSKILPKSEIDRFLSSADDKEFLMIKVRLLLLLVCISDIEDVGSFLIVLKKFQTLRQRFHESLWLPMWEICLNCFENTCPFVLPTSSISAFFCTTKQENVVRSQLARIPWEKFLDCYTGHCLRRSSATLLADAGVDITTIKRHAGWKSTTVAEGYVENSIENKTKIANQVLVGTTTSAITKTVNVSESNIPSNINFENCTNVTFNLNVNK
ncbi:hypothetical protein NQ317_006501 [Molorchus minor]|uniref:Tyr recombinase domain-containing protein n=1 Tax=Molorchus minor TaxID=1323400 RepID=A0ABQ9J1A6_9CUCU|nr:hypothetical protein NQ317_006501 [Molorchus minor]